MGWSYGLSVVASLVFLSRALADESAPTHASGRPSEKWMVIGADKQTRTEALDALSLLIESELQNSGRNVATGPWVSSEVAKNLRGSYRELDAQVRVKIQKGAKQALDEVVAGHYGEVEQLWQSTYSLAREFISAIGREPEINETFGNLCLFSVRAFEEAKKTPQAEKRTLECMHLIPDLIVNIRWHPPEIVALSKRVREAAVRAESGKITIQVMSGFEPDCSIRVNGRQFASSQSVVLQLLEGAYEAMLDCPQHRVNYVYPFKLRAKANASLQIDGALDSVLEIRPRVRVVSEAWAQDITRHISSFSPIAHMAEATHLVLISPHNDQVASMRLYMPDPTRDWGLRAMTLVPYFETGNRAAKVREAIDHLAAFRSMDCSVDPSRPLPAETLNASSGGAYDAGTRSTQDSRGWSTGETIGLTALGTLSFVGLVANITALWSWGEHQQKVTSATNTPAYASEPTPEQLRDRTRNFALVSGGVFATSTIAMLPLMLPSQDTARGDPAVPALAWVSGAAGLAMTGIGLWFTLAPQGCGMLGSDADCAGGRYISPLGPSLMMYGSVLMSVPSIYLIRDWTNDKDVRKDNGIQSVSLEPWFPAYGAGGAQFRFKW